VRILLVEDEPGVRRLVVLALEARGHEVTAVNGGLEAWETLSAETQTFDRVLTDVRMPDMSGSELVHAMRSRGIDTPTVLMSGHLEEASGDSNELPSVAYLKKPFSLAQLHRALGTADDTPPHGS
jgi:CheY-like chemotaxis protein